MGSPMGPHLSLILVDIYMNNFENQIINKGKHNKLYATRVM